MTDKLPRKLTAILYADVAGYSRLTGNDEDATHRSLASHLDFIDQQVRAHRGKVMHYAGDAVLSRFKAVVDAVSCAIEIQRQLETRNAEFARDNRVQFRIGVNLGDVIVDRGDIYGDGVNVAARLETIAEPGGICVSASVFEQVKGKLGIHFQDLGEQDLKNIEGPVRAYRVTDEPMPSVAETFKALTGDRIELPEKPSIAVLPFHNRSGDPQQEHFADGMSEDIITVLSRVPELVVIARNSTFVYKERSIDIREIGHELGVGYVLEGSVRKAGERLRITAQLINAVSGDHVWSERYDRHLDDIFAVQDEITREIVVALSVKLAYGEEMRVWSDRTADFETWELFQRGVAEQLAFTREGNREAQRIARRIVELNPEFKMPWALLGWALLTGARYGFVDDAAAAIDEAESIALQLLEENEQDGDAHALLGFVLTNKRQFEDGIRHGKRAIELTPSVATNHAVLSIMLYYTRQYEESLMRIKKALRLSPYAQDWFLATLCDCYLVLGGIARARDVCEHLATRMPNSILSLTRLALIHSELGDINKTREAVRNLISISPSFSVHRYVEAMPFRYEADRRSYADSLLKAGLPE